MRRRKSTVLLALLLPLTGCQVPLAQLAEEAGSVRLRGGGVATERPLQTMPGTLVLLGPAGPLADGTRVRWDGVDLVVANGVLTLPPGLLARGGPFFVVVDGFEPLEVAAGGLAQGRLQLRPPGDAAALAVGTPFAPGAPAQRLPAPAALRLNDLRLTAGGKLHASDALTQLAAHVTPREPDLLVKVADAGDTPRRVSGLLTTPSALRYDPARNTFIVGAVPQAQAPGLATSLFALATVVSPGSGAAVSSAGRSGPLGSQQDTGGAQLGNALVGQDGATLISDRGSVLIGQDGATLISDRGSMLIGLDGSTLVSDRGSALIGLDGSTLVSDRGNALIGLDGSTLVSDRGTGLTWQSGSPFTAGGSGLAAVVGFPYFPAQALSLAKYGLRQAGPAAPLQRETLAGILERLWPQKTLVRALDLDGRPLSPWVVTQSSGAYVLALSAPLPPVYVLQAQFQEADKPLLRAFGLGFAPGVENRPSLFPLDSASTMVTSDILFLLDYTAQEIARLEARLAQLPENSTQRTVAQARLLELKGARAAFNPLFYAEDLRLAERTLKQGDAEALSRVNSLREAYDINEKVRRRNPGAGRPQAYTPISPDSPPELNAPLPQPSPSSTARPPGSEREADDDDGEASDGDGDDDPGEGDD
ncbi:MAG: hypothetical protein VKP62_15555 [Candidatus Sericytochromatia bacterium]|nr:hypothetical protein [Candidatus Sericytochromatia bacterium]